MLPGCTEVKANFDVDHAGGLSLSRSRSFPAQGNVSVIRLSGRFDPNTAHHS